MTMRTTLLALALLASPALADDYALPDPIMTPGAVDPGPVCAKRHRHLPPGLSAQVARAYNVPPEEIGVTYQLDHLVPYSISGATTARNLWPQPMAEAGVKDVCDRRVHILVCDRKTVSAADAQREMAADWPAACARYLGMM